jgi:hypothetical protein
MAEQEEIQTSMNMCMYDDDPARSLTDHGEVVFAVAVAAD